MRSQLAELAELSLLVAHRDQSFLGLDDRLPRDKFAPGDLLLQDGWEHLCLPAEYEPSHPFVCPRDPRTIEGELLCPERFGKPELAALKRQLGTYGAAGQLQQRPAPAGGGIFKRAWWQWYDPHEPLPPFDLVLQSWDLAFGGGTTADYVVGQAWAKIGANKYLLHQIRRQMDFVATIAAVGELTEWIDQHYPGHNGHSILVEKAANGAALIDTLRKHVSSIIPVEPKGSKELRAQAVSPQIEAGNVWLPGHADPNGAGFDRARTPSWVQEFVHETESFPTGSNDDQVDAMAQALARLSVAGPRIRAFTYPNVMGPFAGRWPYR